MFGQGLWRKLCANSRTRNYLICVKMRDGHEWRSHCIPYSSVKLLKAFPSTALKYGIPCDETTLWASKNIKRLKDKDQILLLSHLYGDTQNMARQAGERINFKWSERRMREEHDRLAREITAKKYYTKPFDTLGGIPRHIQSGKFEAILLDSPFEMANEGALMGNCVASYIQRVANGNYLVYRVLKDGQHSSTLGISRTTQGGRFSQHYGARNTSVSAEASVFVNELLIEYGESFKIREEEEFDSISMWG